MCVWCGAHAAIQMRSAPAGPPGFHRDPEPPKVDRPCWAVGRLDLPLPAQGEKVAPASATTAGLPLLAPGDPGASAAPAVGEPPRPIPLPRSPDGDGRGCCTPASSAVYAVWATLSMPKADAPSPSVKADASSP